MYEICWNNIHTIQFLHKHNWRTKKKTFSKVNHLNRQNTANIILYFTQVFYALYNIMFWRKSVDFTPWMLYLIGPKLAVSARNIVSTVDHWAVETLKICKFLVNKNTLLRIRLGPEPPIVVYGDWSVQKRSQGNVWSQEDIKHTNPFLKSA